MKPRSILGAALAAVSAATVQAGLYLPLQVTLQDNPDGSGSASGDMPAARFSDNTKELIGCGIRASDDGAGGLFQWGFCQAADATGEFRLCLTERADFLEVLRVENDYSFIQFRWNADGECTHIGFSTQSQKIPEHVEKKKKKPDDD